MRKDKAHEFIGYTYKRPQGTRPVLRGALGDELFGPPPDEEQG